MRRSAAFEQPIRIVDADHVTDHFLRNEMGQKTSN